MLRGIMRIVSKDDVDHFLTWDAAGLSGCPKLVEGHYPGAPVTAARHWVYHTVPYPSQIGLRCCQTSLAADDAVCR